MSRAFLTAVVATLALGSFTPRLAAQDTTSARGQVRPDTSGYTGAGGVDTTAQPERVGASDTIRAGGADTSGLTGDSTGVTDTSGMRGPRTTDSTKAGQTTSPRSGTSSDSGAAASDSGAAASDSGATSSDSGSSANPGQSGYPSDSAGVAQPSPQPGQSTSPTKPSGPNAGANR